MVPHIWSEPPRSCPSYLAYMSGTTDPAQFRELLAYYMAGLQDGAILPEQIAAWSDRIIAQDDEIDPFFADLAVAGHDVNRILSTLKEFLGPNRLSTGYRVSLGDLYWRLERSLITPAQALNRLDRFLYASTDVDDAERYRLMGAEGDLDLAVDRIYGSVDDAMVRLKNDLAIYSGFQVEDPEKWRSANEQVEATLKSEAERREAREAAQRTRPPAKRKPWWRL